MLKMQGNILRRRCLAFDAKREIWANIYYFARIVRQEVIGRLYAFNIKERH